MIELARSYATRRQFLRGAIVSGGVSLLALQNSLSLAQATLLGSGDYAAIDDHKSLVCVFLFGGNDSHNTVVPYGTDAYARYASIRRGLAIDRSQLIGLPTGEFGFHPGLAGLAALYSEGRVAVVRGVGNLIKPTSRADIIAERAHLPANLFSHNDQQEIWQTNQTPQFGVTPPGWGGRMGDLLAAANPGAEVPPGFSLFGTNFWQTGAVEATRQPFAIGYGGVSSFNHFDHTDYPPREGARSDVWQAILNMRRENRLAEQSAHTYRQAVSRLGAVRAALAEAPAINTPYNPRNRLAAQLRQVAELVAVRERLGLKRQLFMVALGGFDTHGNHLEDHAMLLGQLDEALLGFYRTTEELGVADSVTTFTASEFGRTLTSNGDGTDHAWASDYFVMGGAVRGGRMLGETVSLYPSEDVQTLANGERAYGPRDIGSGRFIPHLSVEQYAATMASWMGLTTGDIGQILPNIANFREHDLGFLNTA